MDFPLEQANTAWDPDIFKNVSNDLEAYQEALAGYIKAQEQEKNATENLALAKENLARIERERAASRLTLKTR